MKLVCFPNYTAGSLVVDLLNNTKSPIIGMKIPDNLAHNMLKVGDNGRVFREFDRPLWERKLAELPTFLFQADWYGTHCHPSCLPDDIIDRFDKVIGLTTEALESRYYRYIRYIRDDPSRDPKSIAELVAEPFESDSRCTNIEFSDIVTGKFVDLYKLNIDHFNAWRRANPFLYYESNPELLDIFCKHCKLKV